MSLPVKTVKKLIEVALPLDAINAACAHEKMPGIGPHPRGLHLWWARRPLAAARAVIFSQMVNDPAGRWELEHPDEIPPGHLKASWAAKRKQLFNVIEELVLWENTANEAVLDRARAEIKKSWRESCDLNRDHPQAAELFNPDRLPGLHDPFAGGGAIPLEAQRLGLEAFASDLNPVAVLINKAMIEIPPKFSDSAPVGPHPNRDGDLALRSNWKGRSGLAEDIYRYGHWIWDRACAEVGHLYPEIEITPERASIRPDLHHLVGEKLTVIAWIWARTVRSPSPAFSGIEVPLAANFVLANKDGRGAYIEPVVEGTAYRFEVRNGTPPAVAKEGTKAPGRGSNFRCLLSGAVIGGDYIKAEGKAKRMGSRMLAVVADGPRGRIYISPDRDLEVLAKSVEPTWQPVGEVPPRLTGGTCVPYGLGSWGELYTARQLKALTKLSDLVVSAIEVATEDAVKAGMSGDMVGLEAGGRGALAYAQAIGLFLAFAVDRCTDFNNTITRWSSSNQKVMNLFSKQAIPMTWDFPEANVLANTVGGFLPACEFISKCALKLSGGATGSAFQADAQSQVSSKFRVVSTDPPYYDNIGYADLSDFFYLWLRRSLRAVYPSLFSTLAVPKAEELVATPHRHGSQEKAESFFLTGMTAAMHNIAELAHPEMPVTIYYAFKQAETEDVEGTASTGWETFLAAVLQAGFSIVGTWPMRSEQEFRMVGMGTNALASSIILVCRRRSDLAPTVSRREFLRELNLVLPGALEGMVHGTEDGVSPVAPVDLSQAIIGPGMAVFSKYSAVLESDGSRMTVKTALQLINRYFAANDFDPDTQWCLKWFEQHGWNHGQFGQADVLARAMGTSVAGVAGAGVVSSSGGIVRLLRPAEYPTDWDPRPDSRVPIWETLHHLIRRLRTEGETATGQLLGRVKSQTEGVRLLAFRLYTLCERAKWADDARTYNELMTSWTAVQAAAGQVVETDRQGELF